MVQETDDNISSWHSGGTKDRALTEKDLNEFFLFFLIENCDFFNPGWLFDAVVDFEHRVLAPVTLEFIVGVPTDLPSCSIPGMTDLPMPPVWEADTPISESSALVRETQQTSILSDTTHKTQGKLHSSSSWLYHTK